MPLRHNEASFNGPLTQDLGALCGEKEYQTSKIRFENWYQKSNYMLNALPVLWLFKYWDFVLFYILLLIQQFGREL